MRVQVLGHTSLLILCGGLRLLTDPLPVPARAGLRRGSHGRGDHVRGLRLYPGVPRIGSRQLRSGRGTLPLPRGRSLTSGHCAWLASGPGLPAPAAEASRVRLLLSPLAPGSGVRRCGESLGYVLDGGGIRVWWTGDMWWDWEFVEHVVTRFRPGAVYVHVQAGDLGWFNLLVPARRLAELRELVPGGGTAACATVLLRRVDRPR